MTCMCSNEKLQRDMTVCVAKACSIREALHTKNMTSTSCGAPVRDKSRRYVIISNSFGVTSALFVGQRFGYKIWAGLGLGPDDWFTLATLLSGVPSTVMNAAALPASGMGRDVWTVPAETMTRFFRTFFAMELLYFFQVAALKLALLFFYMRIFPGALARRLLWATVAVTAAYGVVFVLAGALQCRPVRRFWTQWDGEQDGSCISVDGLAWSNAGISIVLDCWMLAIPLWQLAGLNLSVRRKVGVAMMFCVGTFGQVLSKAPGVSSITVVSFLRLRSLVKFGTDATNPTWQFFDVGLWSTVEINVGIICTCMPTARLLLVRLFPRGLGTTAQPDHGHSRRSRGSASMEEGEKGEKGDGVGDGHHKSRGVEYRGEGEGGDDVERGDGGVQLMRPARLRPVNGYW
ncbi:hypothetical protein E4U41_003649 [Claviceps citrina]|nr:hypothetical protein E4U41_003649 [Claviceps citrina]